MRVVGEPLLTDEKADREGEAMSSGTVVISTRRFHAMIFDLDGVITDTARVHAAAWKRLFDEYLATEAPPSSDTTPFSEEDYVRHVDGRARIDGVEAFLASRGVTLPRGSDTDPPDARTGWGLANRKNRYLLNMLDTDGVDVFSSSVAFLEKARTFGMRTAVVTASRNRTQVLAAGGISDLFEVHVDGVDAARSGLVGKPDPATFLEAAHRLGVEPGRAVVVEDALSGVEAGRRGGFGLVVGVDRHGHAAQMLRRGADVVVSDLAAVDIIDGPGHG